MMKKMTPLLLLACLWLFGQTAHAQANMTGNVIIDPYYGFPNFGKSFASNFESETTSNFKVKGIGPLGLRGEIMLSDKFGVGFDVIYNNYNLNYRNTESDSVYDGNTDTWNVNTTVTENQFKMQRLRIQARFNYHFDISNPKLDAYFGVGAGTNQRFRKAYENGVQVPDETGLGNFTLMPVSLRICTGMRYYFSQHFGINGEIGLGGPILSVGISARF